jgi:glycosyltransferase involved in cell wall biosynthesis
VVRYLIVHDAAPGQFVHIYQHLLKQKEADIVVASRKGSTLRLPVKQVVYDLPDAQKAPGAGYPDQVLALGISLYTEMKAMKLEEGWAPDIILSHASRGASYFLRDLFPDVRIVTLFEWYHGTPDITAGRPDEAFRQKCRSAVASNMPIQREFEAMDVAYTPTHYQRDQFPKTWQDRIEVIHDGIDTDMYRPASMLTLDLAGRRFTKKDEIVTYAARGMEHTRGFLEFMKAVAALQKIRPNVHVFVAAADRICYDPGRKGAGLKGRVDETVDYDPGRTHFVGLLPEAKFVSFLQISSLHVYFTKPFVLSWSLLNAMSAAAPILASRTAPVEEVITPNRNGLLVDMNNIPAITEAMNNMLNARTESVALGKAARQTVLDRYALKDCLKRQLALIHGE